jgi:DNA topoisomerase-1
MAKTLVIVESPAKAKTIGRFLGDDYVVEASYGHIRDLPENADEIPAEFKGKSWARLGVDVDGGFQPVYVVPAEKRNAVGKLKQAAKGTKTLLLATDEDREGESISWHILQVLAPSKNTEIKRIVFHEITPEAIRAALASPRQVDEALVRAQETRRILDRLYGYTLSPLLWKKVAPKLSAGRVQSVAVRLLVMRERQRMAFTSAEYWGVEALLQAPAGDFKAKLWRLDGSRVADGSDFDPDTGKLKTKAVLLDKMSAGRLAENGSQARPWTVTKLETTPGTQSPPPPFMTSTLQQEAGRKLRFSARRTMQIAQQLYEGIDLGGERVGLITYMRTDSLNLAERALEQAREVIRDLYGKDYLPASAKRYKTKSQLAQEAHEAIRPTELTRRPQDVRGNLTKEQADLYELIWKRTIASQMVPARVQRTSVEVTVEVESQPAIFTASGKTIAFPGFLKAYVEGSDDPEAQLADRETLLPALSEGMELTPKQVTPTEHHTKPPARYTEASLVKKLEEEGIGRPSTYATILGTIQDRGYCFQRTGELIPTFVAFSVVELLENHFAELVDLKFTAQMENRLDEIATGRRNWVEHLSEFYQSHGDHLGLVEQVAVQTPEIPFPRIQIGSDPDTGQSIIVRVGRYGTFLQLGEGDGTARATLPNETAPADLTVARALELLAGKKPAAEVVGSQSGRNVVVRKGRFGDYIEVEQTDEDRAAKREPKRVTLPPDLKPEDLTPETTEMLLSLPRSVGRHPESGEEIVATVGRYGAYIKCGAESRSLANWQAAASVSLEEAVKILAQPKIASRTTAKPGPIRELPAVEGVAGPMTVMSGRFGPYVTDGKTNATLPKGVDPQVLTSEQAAELIQAKAAGGGGSSRSAAAIKEFGPIRVLSGRYGPYVTDGKVNATLPKGTDPESVTAEEAADLIKRKAAAGPSVRPKRVIKRGAGRRR